MRNGPLMSGRSWGKVASLARAFRRAFTPIDDALLRPRRTPAETAAISFAAGQAGRFATPLTQEQRADRYYAFNSGRPLTPRQRRRLRQKEKAAAHRERRPAAI